MTSLPCLYKITSVTKCKDFVCRNETSFLYHFFHIYHTTKTIFFQPLCSVGLEMIPHRYIELRREDLSKSDIKRNLT